MKCYYIEVWNGNGLHKNFWSKSRNAKKHLRDNVPNSDTGARCVVWGGELGEVRVSACAYDEKGVIRYINW